MLTATETHLVGPKFGLYTANFAIKKKRQQKFLPTGGAKRAAEKECSCPPCSDFIQLIAMSSLDGIARTLPPEARELARAGALEPFVLENGESIAGSVLSAAIVALLDGTTDTRKLHPLRVITQDLKMTQMES